MSDGEISFCEGCGYLLGYCMCENNEMEIDENEWYWLDGPDINCSVITID